MELVDRIWYDLTNTSYQAIYASIYNSKLRNFSDRINWFTTIITSATVGAWAIWEQYPEIWAVIIAIAQIINLSKPYISKVRDYEVYHELQLYYEERHFELDYLWLKISMGDLTEDEIKSSYKAMYEKYHNLAKKFLKVRIEENEKIADKAITEWNRNLAKYGINHEQEKPQYTA